MRTRIFYHKGESWEVVGDAPPPAPRAFMIGGRGDTMDPMRSMADGRMYTSRSTYLRETEAQGYHVVEGDMASTIPKPATVVYTREERFAVEKAVVDVIEAKGLEGG